MPKKFSGENSKATAARARKTAAKEEEQRRKEKEKEDEYWKDDDKLIRKKLQRKEEQEKKKLEQIQKKAEIKNLIEKEDLTLKSQSKQPIAKITREQIRSETEKRRAAAAGAAAANKKSENITHINKPLEENVNRLQVDGLEARTITEAISILSTKDVEEDRHPEKRMKAAYASFEAAHLPRIKEENPTLRLSQLKQILHKEWMKSPENPMNQRNM